MEPQGAGHQKGSDPQQEWRWSFGPHHHLAGDTTGGGGGGLQEDAGTAGRLTDQQGFMRTCSVPFLTVLMSLGPRFLVVTTQALAQWSHRFSHPEEWPVVGRQTHTSAF